MCGGAGVEPGYDSLKISVLSREWNLAEESAIKRRISEIIGLRSGLEG